MRCRADPGRIEAVQKVHTTNHQSPIVELCFGGPECFFFGMFSLSVLRTYLEHTYFITARLWNLRTRLNFRTDLEQTYFITAIFSELNFRA